MGRYLLLFAVSFFVYKPKALSQLHLPLHADSARPTVSLRILPQNFYKQHLPFSCKTEVRLQQITGLPLFVRLGSKDQVDYLEQKPAARKPNL